MNVSIVGSSYVGTTVADCFADYSHKVIRIDVNDDIITPINDEEAPIYEPGLNDLLPNMAVTTYGQLPTTPQSTIRSDVPRPPHSLLEDGSIDLNFLKAGVRSLGEAFMSKDDSHLVVVKFTVVRETTKETAATLLADISGKTLDDDLHVAMNPKFLSEVSAAWDFQSPNKVVLGTRTAFVRKHLQEIFDLPIIDYEASIVETGIREAEMMKYVNNDFLTPRSWPTTPWPPITSESASPTSSMLSLPWRHSTAPTEHSSHRPRRIRGARLRVRRNGHTSRRGRPTRNRTPRRNYLRRANVVSVATTL